MEVGKIWSDTCEREFSADSEYRIRIFVAFTVLELLGDLWTLVWPFWPKMPTLWMNISWTEQAFEAQLKLRIGPLPCGGPKSGVTGLDFKILAQTRRSVTTFLPWCGGGVLSVMHIKWVMRMVECLCVSVSQRRLREKHYMRRNMSTAKGSNVLKRVLYMGKLYAN